MNQPNSRRHSDHVHATSDPGLTRYSVRNLAGVALRFGS